MVKKPWLYLSPEMAYKLAPLALKFHGTFYPTKKLRWQPFEWKGIHFDNPLGISGGVDKNAEHLKDWWSYGPGFLELGTVTPKAQQANPGKIIDRNQDAMGVWNKMGFPNQGLARFRKRIEKLNRPYATPVFINVGKNRNTSNENAHNDYIRGMLELVDFADAFVINISSPNTKGLRDLFNKESLSAFLNPIFEARAELSESSQKPMLLKLSPDHTDEQLDNILQVSLDAGIDGWIFTNTSATAGRQHGFPQEGGVSGAPLTELSKTALVKALARLASDREGKLIVSSGGIMTPEQVFERLEMGADLVQVYSALIFEGPGFFETVARQAESR